MCPFCNRRCPPDEFCLHFIGWTEDGTTVAFNEEVPMPMLPGDRIVTTFGLDRVFRDTAILLS